MAREFVARKGLIVSGSTLASGSITATTYFGDGSNLTGISAGGVTINNNINDYLVTATGTANTVNGEANLRFSGTILSTTSSIALRGTDTSGTTKAFHIQTGDGTSIMDFRNETYAFFGCGQGAGNASGFIFRWRSPGYTQLTGYTYGNGSSPSYQPIYFDTDQIGRGQGIYINYTTGSAPASTEFAVKGIGTTSATFTAKFQNSSLTDVFTIQDNGDVRATGDITAYYSSDKNLKTNIKNISNPIEKIKQIGGYEFDWKLESEKTGYDVGVIAQEIEAILPEVVTTRDNGYKAVRYEKIIPLLIEAIKEQQQQIDDLKSKLL